LRGWMGKGTESKLLLKRPVIRCPLPQTPSPASPHSREECHLCVRYEVLPMSRAAHSLLNSATQGYVGRAASLLVKAFSRPSIPAYPERTLRTRDSLGIVNALFVRAADDPIYHHYGPDCMQPD